MSQVLLPPTWWIQPPLAVEAQSRIDRAGPQAISMHPHGPYSCLPLDPPRRSARPAAPGARCHAVDTPPHPQTLAPYSTDIRSPKLPLAAVTSAPRQHAAALRKPITRHGANEARQVGAHPASWAATPEPSAEAMPEAEARARSRACVRLFSFLYGLNSSHACMARCHTSILRRHCKGVCSRHLAMLEPADVLQEYPDTIPARDLHVVGCQQGQPCSS